jgi:hypothetical protein
LAEADASSGGCGTLLGPVDADGSFIIAPRPEGVDRVVYRSCRHASCFVDPGVGENVS